MFNPRFPPPSLYSFESLSNLVSCQGACDGMFATADDAEAKIDKALIHPIAMRSTVEPCLQAKERRSSSVDSDEVRKWAEDAMTARTALPPQLPSLGSSNDDRLQSKTRDTFSGLPWSAKSSAPASISNTSQAPAISDDLLRAAATDFEYMSLGATRKSSSVSPSAFVRERPTSMFVEPSGANHAQAKEDQRTPTRNQYTVGDESSAAAIPAHPPQVTLKSCLKACPPEDVSGKAEANFDTSVPTTSIRKSSSMTHVHKSVHICEDLPHHKDENHNAASHDAPSLSSPTAARLVRRNAAHRRVLSEVTRGAVHNALNTFNDSPTLTESNGDSDEEVPILVTPSDENGPRGLESGLYGSPSSQRVQVRQSNGLGRHPSSDALQHVTEHTWTSKQRHRSAHAHGDKSSPSSSSSHSASAFGHANRELAAMSAATLSMHNSVVSTGLELGLGMSMTAAALSAQGMSTPAGMQGVAYSRFTRPAEPLSAESAQADPPRVNLSDQAIEEKSFDDLDREDADLNRRRTTGGLQKQRGGAHHIPSGKRRVQRTGTQDPYGSRRSHAPPMPHSRNTSVSTMAEIEEALTAEGSHSTLDSSALVEVPGAQNLASTPLDTPSHSHKALISPSINYHGETGSFYSPSGHVHDASAFVSNAKNGQMPEGQPTSAANLVGGLMGIGEAGHFGPGVRAKVAQLRDALIDALPLSGASDETINMVEYGALNSRSAMILRPAISSLTKRKMHSMQQQQEVDDDTDVGRKRVGAGDYFEKHGSSASAKDGSNAATDQESSLTFSITLEDATTSDFRPLSQLLDSHQESYLNPAWQAGHTPCLTNKIFSSSTARPFASRVAPPRSVHFGISLMDLHWIHTPITSQVSRATTAQAELTAFLQSRAAETKKGGVMILAYIARGDESFKTSVAMSSSDSASSEDVARPVNSTPAIAARKDIWTTLSNTLAPCIQRLVSCGMLKADVARHLLELPMHPRTAKQTHAALKDVEKSWQLEWSCGLGRDDEALLGLPSEPQPLRLPHPAWKAFESGCLSRVPFTEHMLQLFKNLYEAHFRSTLRERGRLSKGAAEFVLDSLWDALFNRILDHSPTSMKDIEIEVCVYALRKT